MAGMHGLVMGVNAPICFLYCPTTLKAWQALYFRNIYGVIFMCVFVFLLCTVRVLAFFVNLRNTHNSNKKLFFGSLLGAFWEPSGNLWETFGDQGTPKAPKSVPKATQRLQGSPKAPKSVRKDEMARISQEV